MTSTKLIPNISRVLLSVFIGVFIVFSAQANDEFEGNDPFARFGDYSEESDLSINHDAWDEVLLSTVVIIPPSTRRMASIPHKPKTGTRIPRGSKTPARYESNRVVFHLLEEDHMGRVAKYRQELQNLPDYYPLAEFSRDEQLAYWLNLHNVILYEELAKRYPFSNLRKYRSQKRGKASLWDQKLVIVEGVALSLNDIQNNILIRHWQSPMVLYGLFHGTIGGPSLSERAFTAKNVHNILRQKAKEFINSNRGFRGARVSLVYDWGKNAFPDWENDLARHLVSFAIPEFQAGLLNSEPFTPDLYDWSIADIMGGTLSAGPKDDTAVNILAAGALGPRGQNLLNEMLRSGLIARGGFNQNTLDLMREVARKYEELPDREGVVYSEECGTEICPEGDAEPTAEGGGEEPEGNFKD